MTLSSTTTRASYAGDGTTTVFAVPFYFLHADHLTVVLRDAGGVETTWVRGTHYTVFDEGNPAGGSIAVETDPTDHTPAAGTTLVILRAVPLTQETDYTEGDPLPSATLERDFDKARMVDQQLAEALDRALTFSQGSPSAGITMPEPEAGRLLGWTGAGDGLTNYVAADIGAALVSDFAATLLDDADATAARGTLGLGSAAIEAVAPGGSTGLLRADGDGSQLTGVGIAGEAALGAVAALAMRVAIDRGWTLFDLMDGVVDAFEDTAGIDAGVSSGAFYDAGADLYGNEQTALLSFAPDWAAGGFSAATYVQLIPAAAVPSGGTQIRVGFAASPSAALSVTGAYVGRRAASGDVVDFAAGLFGQLRFTGNGSVTVPAGTTAWSDWLTLDVSGSHDLLVAFHTPTSGLLIKTGLSGHQYHYKSGGNDTATQDKTGYTIDHGVNRVLVVDAIEIRAAAGVMTLTSTAAAADSAPATIRPVLFAAHPTATLNTDLVAEVSRDDGTTWTAATLTDAGAYSGDVRILDGGAVDVSAQPAGTAVRLRARTPNSDTVAVHAWSRQWR